MQDKTMTSGDIQKEKLKRYRAPAACGQGNRIGNGLVKNGGVAASRNAWLHVWGKYAAYLKPCGLFFCQRQVSSHISRKPRPACQPSSTRALVGSAKQTAISPGLRPTIR